MTRTTTGDTTVDAVIALGAVVLLLGILLLLAIPTETTDVGRRWSWRLLEAIFGPLPGELDR